MALPITAAECRALWPRILNEEYEKAFWDEWTEVFNAEYRAWTIEELSEDAVLNALREIENGIQRK